MLPAVNLIKLVLKLSSVDSEDHTTVVKTQEHDAKKELPHPLIPGTKVTKGVAPLTAFLGHLVLLRSTMLVRLRSQKVLVYPGSVVSEVVLITTVLEGTLTLVSLFKQKEELSPVP